MKSGVQQASKKDINWALLDYKTPNGYPDFKNLLLIPSVERLPAMAKNDYQGTLDLVVAGVALAMESMNLKRPMTAEQINDLAEEIVDTATEDNLGLEDLILFLQGLTRGKYGELYESMDIPKFMEKFEIYRQARHEELLTIRENEHLYFKGLGSAERSTQADPLSEHFSKFASTLSGLRQTVKEMRK